MTSSSSPTLRSYQFPVLGRGSSAPSCSPASFDTSSTTRKLHDLVPCLELPIAATLLAEDNKSSEDDDDVATINSWRSLRAAYDDLVARVDRMRTYVSREQNSATTGGRPSELLRACIETLDSRMPHILHQTFSMIQDVETSSERGSFVTDVRSTFALYRAIQYVDRLQEAIDPTTNEGIEEQLLTVLSGLQQQQEEEGQQPGRQHHHPAFRLSPWVASDLCFDLPMGQSAYHTIPGDLTVEIESIVEFRAHDQPSVNYARAAAATPVIVTILSCKHVKRHFGLGAGTIGQATITVRLEPLSLDKQPVKVWAVDQPVPALQIKEARAYVQMSHRDGIITPTHSFYSLTHFTLVLSSTASNNRVQLNAYPPKPRASIDMNTSYTYGDAGVTITMVVTTCVTSSSAADDEYQQEPPPNLLVELFMAPPKAM
jgi:hypothetical protein